MTLQQVFKEIEVIGNLVCDTTRVQLVYNEVGSDEELINHCKDNDINLHEPSQELPFYFFFLYEGNVDAIIQGKKKQVTVNY